MARALVDVAGGAGVKTTALITDMNEPLVDAVGNALELRHCIAFLRGEKTDTRAQSIIMALGTLGDRRLHHADTIDHTIGFDGVLPLGSTVSRSQRLGFVHAATEDAARNTANTMQSLYNFRYAEAIRPFDMGPDRVKPYFVPYIRSPASPRPGMM